MPSPQALLTRVRAQRPALDHLVRAFGRYQADAGDRQAAAVTFFGFLSFFPVLALATSVLSYALGPAAVDTVGGEPLAMILRSLDYRGIVAACGLVAGTDFKTSVYPFILRGITLAGIDSAKCPRPERLEMWTKLAGPWHVDQLENVVEEITLNELPDQVAKILAGKIVGRTIVAPH